ncbi:MAG: response regulator [Syntrophobacteraceae bacterium]
MGPGGRDFFILVADDDEDDCLLIRDAIQDNGLDCEFRFVYDGKDLMEELYRGRDRSAPGAARYPDLILLDLNMPRKDGREALREIKNDADLRAIPVVVLTTSSDDRDVELCNSLGADSFITKPMIYSEWVEAMETVCRHYHHHSN